MNNVSKLNTRIEELLTPSQIVAFHLDNFFTIPSSLNNIVVSGRVNYNTNPETLRLLVENLVLSYETDVYSEILMSRPDLVEKIRKVYKNA